MLEKEVYVGGVYGGMEGRRDGGRWGFCGEGREDALFELGLVES